jgi:hypothetical protein
MANSFYFQHDYNSANDVKILFLRQQLGIEGYGIFWFIIEQLAQAGGILPLKIIPVLAMQIQTTPDKVASVVNNYDLFTIDENQFFSNRLLQQLEFRKQLSSDGKAGALKRWGLKQIDSHPISPPISVPNAKERKGKKEKESKGNIYRSFKHLSMTTDEYKKIIEQGYTDIQLMNILDDIENYAGNKKYTSLYLTALKWLKKDSAKTNRPKNGYVS